MKVYIVVEQDYEIINDIKVYLNKKFLLDKLYNENKEYIKSLKSTDNQKQVWLDYLEEQYKNENLEFFNIFEKEII